MSQSESDYSSSSEEDDDYIPSGEEESGDELEGVVEEEGLDTLTEQKKARRKGKESSTKRRRKGWAALEEDGAKDEENEEAARAQKEIEDAKQEEARQKKEETEKKRADDLWSSFLSDVKQKPKPKSSTSQNGQTSNPKPPVKEKIPVSKDEAAPTTQEKCSKSSGTMKITKVFDFAGEEVKITKEVASSSREAKNYIKQQEEQEKKKLELTSPASSSLSSRLGTNVGSLSGTASKPTVTSGLKRPGGGLGNVLGQIGKKQKISTLEKSRLDWESFKTAEGISEELKIHNKGKEGFVEKQKFLQRADVRQYEIERELRLAQSKIHR